MRVVVFGAGASKKAGYPLAGELLPTIGKAAVDTTLNNFKTAWERWEEKREELPDEYKHLLASPNPEITFSLIDLLEAAGDESTRSQMRSAQQELDQGRNVDMAAYEAFWDSPFFEHIDDARTARAALLECLKWYFSFMHHYDRERQNERAYLKALLGELRPSDVVLTLNWDTIAERVLGELGRWNPTTGYGFEHPLVLGSTPGGRANSAELHPSEIPVLKLHGSFGWYSRLVGGLYFGDMFLTEFGFERDARPLYIKDPLAPSYGPEEDPVLLYPSYLKKLDNKELQTVWQAAKRALDEADEIEIWGYSLPASDTAVRTLLNVLAFRLEQEEAAVVVHNPNAEARARWAEFLGPRVQLDDSRLE